jgi:serine/threonine-protein kinase
MTPEAQIRDTLLRSGVDAERLAVGATIARPVAPASQPPSPPAGLPRLGLASDGAGVDLVAVRELGRGGMGVVHLAEQRSLLREVAVKTARAGDAHVAEALVREARIMGALEHPSLVPVHALGVSAGGEPVLVMKRVEGVAWRDLMRDAEHPAWPHLLAGHGDRLRAHVEILVQLSRALAFAHDRGILHRDLKPDNVMIGRFGEVYLLDWGLALRLSERSSESSVVVGTPGYLPPEMALGQPERMDARTDVYLLGATLYEVLTGHMPHDAGSTMAALLSSAMGTQPPLPAGAPRELCQLVERAMATDSQARLASAEAFQEGLQRWLGAQKVDLVIAEARATLERARQAAAGDPSSPLTYQTLVEARFGLAQARKLRPEEAALATDLDDCVSLLVERELALASPTAARAWLGELGVPRPELTRRVEALAASADRDHLAAMELERTRRDADPSSAVHPLSRVVPRAIAICLVAGLLIALPGIGSGGGFPVRNAVAIDLGVVLMLGLCIWAFRRSLFLTAGSRRITWSYTVWALGLFFADLAAFATGVGTPQASVHSMVMGAVGGALLSVTVERALWPSVPAHTMAALGSLLLPRFAPLFVSTALAFNGFVFVRAWRIHAARTQSPR